MTVSTPEGDGYVHEAPTGHLARWISVVVAVVMVAFVAVLAFGGDDDTGSRVVGDLVPRVAGATLDGGTYDIDDERGRWVVVNFFASWCAPCRVEHPELAAFAARHEARGDASVVGVVFQDDLDDVRAFFDELGGDWPVVVENTSAAAVAFGVTGAPETYLVAPDGTVVAAWNGTITAAELDLTIARHEASAS